MQRGTALIRRATRAPVLVIVSAILDEFDITYALGFDGSSFFGEPQHR